MKVIGRNASHLFVCASVLVVYIFALPEEVTKNGRKEYTFLWFIENYSYSYHENGEVLDSPAFTVDVLESTNWYLSLYPRGSREEEKGYISLYLCRSEVDDGPEDMHVNYELSILAADASALNSTEGKHIFKRDDGNGAGKLLQIDDVLLRKKPDYLPQDILNVRCKIWRDGEDVQQKKQIYARTRIEIEHISFLHEVEGFSVLRHNQDKTIKIRSPSKQGLSLTSSLYFSNDSWCDGNITVEIKTSDNNKILTRYKLYLLDVSGNVVQCGKADNRFGATRKDIRKMPLSLSRREILNRKSEFLQDDKLSLLWLGIFSTGIQYEKIESTLHQIPFVASKHIHDDDQNKELYNVAEKLSACPGALEDFKTIYNNKFLTDVELKTKTKSFPAHKIVLCARSSVFNGTLTNNMTKSVIQVDDLEDDTVRELLLFLYSDNLEELNYESTIKLYQAADKYKIKKLTVMCSSFLIDNLTISSASEVLLLADNHNDSDLQMAVEDFIFKNEEQVFISKEWRKLTETNPVLVSKTMLLKYMRKF